VASIELLYNVCAGNNIEARFLVQGYAPYDALLKAMSKETLPATFRCHLTKFMHHVYVERHDIDYIVPQFSTQLLNKVDSDRAKDSLPGPLYEVDKELSGFRALKQTALQCLSTHARGLVPEVEPDYNKLTLALTNLTAQLLYLGFFLYAGASVNNPQQHVGQRLNFWFNALRKRVMIGVVEFHFGRTGNRV
jgi:hypothetical protein